jgi:hypothetical protein
MPTVSLLPVARWYLARAKARAVTMHPTIHRLAKARAKAATMLQARRPSRQAKAPKEKARAPAKAKVPKAKAPRLPR